MRRGAAACLVAVATIVLVACGADHEDQALCPAYADYVRAADAAIEAMPATGASVAEAAETVADLRDEAEQLRSVADARYTAQITALIDAIDELGVTLDSAPGDDDFTTWRPLVQETLEAALDADEMVRDLLGPECDLSRVLDEEE